MGSNSLGAVDQSVACWGRTQPRAGSVWQRAASGCAKSHIWVVSFLCLGRRRRAIEPFAAVVVVDLAKYFIDTGVFTNHFMIDESKTSIAR